MNDDPHVSLRLTRAEALVLFEWLARSDKAGSYAFSDPAEKCVLWRVEGQLEKALPEPFLAEYLDRVTAARAEVRAEWGDPEP